jgi:ribonuclease Z
LINHLRISIPLAVCLSMCGQNVDPKQPASDASTLTITILGSGAGPPVNLQRYGASILVEASGQKLLFDCGRGVAFRLAELGIRYGEMDKVFLTHLHSDHIISLPDLLLTGWSAGRRTTPFRVWGPAGTKHMMDKLQEAFAFDIHSRRDVSEKFSSQGIAAVSTDIKEGVVYERGSVKVTAFLVDHGPVKPAFGYRVDDGGRSVVMSGDTRFSENLIKFSRGADLLIHEVVHTTRSALMGSGLTAEQAATVLDLHTPVHLTADVFNRVKPRLAVYSHGGSEADVAEARKTYSGPLEVGEDLMTIEVSDQIKVRRRGHGAP